MIIQSVTEKELAEAAARIISERIEVLLRKQQNVVLAVPGGRSVSGVFAHLANHDIPWQQIHLFLLDERLVPLDDPQSNYLLVSTHLPAGQARAALHPFNLDPDNPVKSTAAYEEELQAHGGQFDIVLASAGEDGHIASIFPDHPSVEEKSPGFIIVDDAPKPPPGRMSAGIELIRKADTGVLLFLGAAKKSALTTFLDPHVPYQRCPARIITQLPCCYVLTDQEVGVS